MKQSDRSLGAPFLPTEAVLEPTPTTVPEPLPTEPAPTPGATEAREDYQCAGPELETEAVELTIAAAPEVEAIVEPQATEPPPGAVEAREEPLAPGSDPETEAVEPEPQTLEPPPGPVEPREEPTPGSITGTRAVERWRPPPARRRAQYEPAKHPPTPVPQTRENGACRMNCHHTHLPHPHPHRQRRRTRPHRLHGLEGSSQRPRPTPHLQTLRPRTPPRWLSRAVEKGH